MSYYWFNRKEILQKVKERHSKEKAAKYYSQNKEAIKEKSKNRYKNLSKEEKGKINKYLGIMMMVLTILLVVKKVRYLHCYVLPYLKRLDT